MSTSNTIALSILAVIVLCVGGAGIIGSFIDDPKPSGIAAASAAPERVVDEPTMNVTTSAVTPAEETSPAAKPRPSATHKVVPKPKPTTKEPKPKPSKTTSGPRKGVHPGAFCSPFGALGYTSAGTLMECKPSATDERNRWRKA